MNSCSAAAIRAAELLLSESRLVITTAAHLTSVVFSAASIAAVHERLAFCNLSGIKQ